MTSLNNPADQSTIALNANVDDLETRLTAARAGYLDNLSAGAVAQAASVGTLSNSGGGTATLGAIIGDVANSSIAARLTALDAQLDNLGANIVSSSITYNGSVSYPVYTVTGLVAVRVIGYITTPLSNHADSTSLGTASSAAGLLPATAGTAMQTANQVWVDNAPSKFETLPTSWTLIGAGEDIAAVGTANLTEGVVTFYCWYVPFSTGAGVVSATS